MEQTKKPTLTKADVENMKRDMYGRNKNTPTTTPQASDNSADAGGHVDLEALKQQLASQTAASEAADTTVPTPQKPAGAQPSATERLYAGKYKDIQELEDGYKNLESKLGQKSDAERIGEEMLKYSGRTPEQLKADIESAILEQQTPPTSTREPEQQSVQPQDPKLAAIESELRAIKANNLLRQLQEEKASLFAKYPEAKKYDGTLDDLWKNVDIKNSIEEIYEKRFKSADVAKAEIQVEQNKNTFQVESAVGKAEAVVGEIQPGDLTLDQLRQVLPRAEKN